jgi:hypothetical protein
MGTSVLSHRTMQALAHAFKPERVTV